MSSNGTTLGTARLSRSGLLAVILAMLASGYCGIILKRSWSLYDFVKRICSVRGAVLIPDARMGYRFIPSTRADWVYPCGRKVRLALDERGFRVPNPDVEGSPAGGSAPPLSPTVLFLGDSFMFGQGIACQETVPYLVGEGAGVRSLNAAGWGDSLATILLRARELIPRYRPTVVVVQWSDTLYDNSVDYFYPSVYGHIPVPFFVDNGSGVNIHPPVYTRRAFPSLPLADFAETAPGISDYLRFVIRVALPLSLHDDPSFALFALKKQLGLIPAPSGRVDQIVRGVYAEIASLARAHGGTVLVLGWTWQGNVVDQNQWCPLLEEDGMKILDLYPVFCRAQGGGEFHISCSGKIIDTHPSAYVHRLIAGEIIRVLDQLGVAKVTK